MSDLTQIYFNSITLAAAGGTTFGSSGICVIGNLNYTVELLNNIIINNSVPGSVSGLTVALRNIESYINTFSENSNYNNFFAGTPSSNRLIFYDGTNSDQTLNDFQTRVFPREQNSKTFQVNFQHLPTGNLHLAGASIGDTRLIGIPVEGITTDYDNDIRHASSPHIGADDPDTSACNVDAGLDTTIYLGYGSQSVTLTAQPSGGYNPTYLWSPGGATTQSVTVSPTTTTTYTVQVTNSIGCIVSDEVLVNVYDTRCGNNGTKVLICHNGHTICVAPDAVAAHMDHGDYLDSCGVGPDNIMSGEIISEIPVDYMLHVNYPNPFNPVTTMKYDLPHDSKVTLKVYDMRGIE